MADVWQEMYCTQCTSYFGMHFDSEFTGVISIRCGICKHIHQRYILKGLIKEDGRYNNGKPVIDVEVLRSSCYPVSRVQEMMKAQKKYQDVRDGKPAEENEVARTLTDEEKARRQIIMDSWYNKFQHEKFG